MSVRIERDGAVTTVIMSRPEVRNAVDPETALALSTAWSDFEADDEAKAGVLFGEGGTFCAGYDLKRLSGTADAVDPTAEGGPMGPTRALLSKPVIAAIAGHAVAGGMELALWCDLRVMEEDAVLGVFCRRWGVPLVDGGTVRLPRLIGMGRALDLILTGRPVGAEEALSMGLCNRVVAKGGSRQEAEKLAHELARFPQVCLRADRASAYRQWDLELAEALAGEGLGGLEALEREGRAGAGRFAAGTGRHGAFDEI